MLIPLCILEARILGADEIIDRFLGHMTTNVLEVGASGVHLPLTTGNRQSLGSQPSSPGPLVRSSVVDETRWDGVSQILEQRT